MDSLKRVSILSEQELALDAPVRLAKLFATDMGAVNEVILSRMGSHADLVPEVAHHLVGSGGKRIRPMLTLAMGQLCGIQQEGLHTLAAAVEFMHTATLLHDDVVDDSDMRRGKQAARQLWGNKASILVGDFLLAQAFMMMVEVGSLKCLEVLSKASRIIAEGEVLQLMHAHKPDISQETYINVIEAKTAALFSAACEVGPILAHASMPFYHACHTYGHSLGMAFQLIDDVLDYEGIEAELGKKRGDDFIEGKITLPVILAIEAGDSQERAFWHRILAPEFERDMSTFAQACEIMHKHGTLLRTRALAEDYSEKAKNALDCFGPSVLRDILGDVAKASILRTN